MILKGQGQKYCKKLPFKYRFLIVPSPTCTIFRKRHLKKKMAVQTPRSRIFIGFGFWPWNFHREVSHDFAQFAGCFTLLSVREIYKLGVVAYFCEFCKLGENF